MTMSTEGVTLDDISKLLQRHCYLALSESNRTVQSLYELSQRDNDRIDNRSIFCEGCASFDRI